MKKTKFLILRFSSIGDIVLTTPVPRCIKKQYPEAEVHFATKQNFKVLVENNHYIDQYHLLGNSLNELIRQLKSENFDYIIDLHNNLRTSIIKLRLFSVKSISFDKLNFEKWLLVNLKINRMPNVHIVERYLKTVESLGITNDLEGLDYFIPEKDIVNIEKPYVAFAIGGQHATKKLPTKKIIDICSKINCKIVLLGGKEDIPVALEIENALGKQIFNACGKYNLNQSASLVQQSEYLITHDTGLMHIAAALKKKTISIWGNTVPEFGMYPYLTEHKIIENKNLSCRPCSKIGYKQCPKGHFKCMNELEIEI
ncbi:glycosyl transferase family 9 [Emticicia oligotrophica DSM 17448]|uniref:Glycosyl transferase family 9 n=1 Tax=Emticicia oligotrophica (strain DSM 17448 / CIP 109782 / MTCC 6937 / GPTSA100-15) TaxID=929562 RepID=A0ABN4ARM9_EMTOG|nr:glycosyltransferase family 9 protein [Emticicia oligotrophica]AFK05220.1 glycosyl transferase family 9 [Emticicia oligotrophica DSM 17448]